MACSAPTGTATPVTLLADEESLVTDPLGRLAAAYDLTRPDAITRTGRPFSEVAALVRERVDPALLTGAVAFVGDDYHFTPADGRTRHLGRFVIRYGDAAQASAAGRAAATQRVFRNTKILTPMAVAVSGHSVTVLFTETGADTTLLRLLAEAAAGRRNG